MIDPFLAELQEECLKDPEGRLGFLREAAGEVVGSPSASLKKMIKICTEVESNFRSVGFPHSADLFAEFIGYMRAISESFTELGERVSPDDGFVLQFFLTDVIQSFENYFESLKTSEDSETKAGEFRPAVKILSSWRPSAVEPVALAIVPAIVPPVAMPPAAVQSAEAPPVEEIIAVKELARAPVAVTAPSPRAEKAEAAAVNMESIAAALNKPAASASAVEQPNKYLICRGPESKTSSKTKSQARVFAIPVQQVIEVIDRQAVSALPFPRAGLEGILNFRGDPLPVLVCFDRNDDGAKVDASKGKSYVVIANVDERKFGFQMESVLSVTDLDPSRFENPGSWLSPQGGTWVTHLVKQGDDVILVMDLKKAVVA